jgi:ABC-type nitrate/sulfonate/bicarbonate transport system permease component
VRPRRWLGGAFGTLALIGVWVLLATFALSQRVLPEPWSVAAKLVDEWGFYMPHLEQTLVEAAKGYAIGNGIAIATAVVCVQLPFLAGALMRFAIVTYAMPIIAIGPILQILLSGDQPKVALAALSVYFTTLVATMLGLRSADRTSLDLVRAYGGSSWSEFTKVRLRASLPSLFAGLKIAGPAAILGAMIGEYLGAERGLGILMVNSQQTLNVTRTWAVALLASAVAGLAYLAAGLIGNALTPWAHSTRRSA